MTHLQAGVQVVAICVIALVVLLSFLAGRPWGRG